MTSQNKIGEIRVWLDGTVGLHTGKEHFRCRNSRIVDGLGGFGKQIDIDLEKERLWKGENENMNYKYQFLDSKQTAPTHRYRTYWIPNTTITQH